MRSWPLVLLLGGCQALFTLTPPPDGPPGAPPDGPSCTMPTSGFSSFDTPTDKPCDGLGYPNYDTGNLTQVIEAAGGEVHWTPMAGLDATHGGCIAELSQTFDAGGIFIEVIQPASGPTEYMQLKGYWDNTGEHTALKPGGSNLQFFHRSAEPEQLIGMIPLDETTRWWRMRPRPDGLAVIAEVSADGLDWRVFATDERAPPALIKWELETGSYAAESNPSTTIIGSINACP